MKHTQNTCSQTYYSNFVFAAKWVSRAVKDLCNNFEKTNPNIWSWYLGKTSVERVVFFLALPKLARPPRQFGQLGPLFSNIKTVFCALDRKNTDDENYG